MLKNYLKVALRNIKNHKIYSFVNIFGLSVGMACCILIFFYINQELSYDKYHQDAGQIYRVAMKISRDSAELETARVSAPLVPAIRENFPEVESATRFQTMDWRRNLVEYEEKKFYETSVMVADNNIFDVLTIPFLRGEPKNALTRPGTVVVSLDMAYKYFGQMNPIGEMIDIWGRPFEITGVVSTAPENTHVKYGFILSLNGFERTWNLDNWGWTGFYAYLKLRRGVNPQVFERKIQNIANLYIPEKLNEWGQAFDYYLQPLAKIHLHSNLSTEVEAPGNLAYLFIFSAIGFLILLLSIINYVNLTTARSSHRSKEVGIRKVVGAQQSQLARQFIGESFLTVFFSMAGSVLLVLLALPLFNNLTGKSFTPQYMLQPGLFLVLLILTLFVGMSGGSYPAILLSIFKPAGILKGTLQVHSGGNKLRKILVLGQFTVTIFLVIGSLLVFRQIQYMKNMYLGFEKEQKIIVPVQFNNNYESVKDEFLKYPSISDATACWSVPGRTTNTIEARLIGEAVDMAQSMNFLYVDPDFIPSYKIEMAAGRAFQKESPSDVEDTFILNETAAKAFGFVSPDEALGKRMYEGGSGNVGTIIGVTQDFHFEGLQSKVEPLVLQFRPNYFVNLSLTVHTESIQDTLVFIENKWNELGLGNLYNYFFLDEDFNRQYGSEEKVGRLAFVFTVLAVFISCLGLVGLSSFTAEQRTKEIGIRKILGATTPNILLLLIKEFTIWVIAANVLAWPAIYFVMNGWLNDFAYRAKMSLGIFVISGTVMLLLSLLTVGAQSIKTALSNPVDSLRYE